MGVKELLEKRANIWEQAKALIDRAEAENRDLSAEEEQQYQRMMAEMEELAKRAKRLEEAKRLEQELEQRANEPIRASREPQKEKRDVIMAAFRDYLTRGIITQELRDLATTTGAEGGYLVAPQEFAQDLIKAVDNVTFVRKLARVWPLTTSDTLGVVSIDTDLSDADWTSEVGNITADTSLAFGSRTLKPEMLSKLVKVSMKLLKVSAIPAEQIVRDRLAYKFGVTLENALLNGDGSSKPLGVFVADNNGVPTTRDVTDGNTTTAISADSIIAAKYALKEGYRRNAAWIFHRDILKEVAKIKDNDGQYLWRPGLVAGQPDTLSGLPVYESEYAPNTMSAGAYVGILGDFSYYWIAELQDIEIQRLNELFAANSQVGFIGRMYADGQPVLGEAFARIQLATS